MIVACPVLLLLAVTAIAEPQYASGQASNPPPSEPSVPTIKTSVRQVLVPAVVTDKMGHPVSGLRESDFAVFEDNIRQRIVAFGQTYDASLEVPGLPMGGPSLSSNSVTTPATNNGTNSPTRTYLVCMDTLHSSFSNVAQARRALEKFFRSEHDEKAQYALMTIGRQIAVIQDSTRDPSLVLSALANKKFLTSVADGESSSIAFEADTLRKMLRGEIPIPALDLEHYIQMFITSRAERTAILTRLFQQELKNIIQITGSIPTQRTILLISDGFSLVPGRELVGIARAYFPNNPWFRFTERDAQPQLNEVLRLAQQYNVVVYALDSRGLYSPSSAGLGDASHGGDARGNYMPALMQDEDTVAWENGSPLAQLASATGGIYFHDNNDLLAGIHRAFDDERERYAIAYSPSNASADGTYRRIRVEIRNQNYKVYAKAGYWATER
jgi:VWFA-related protein